MFFKGSRYASVPESSVTAADGRVIHYKTTRFISDPVAVVGHRLQQGERLDLVAHQHYQDSERFWRICDANRALWPPSLLEPGRIIRIPPPED